MTSAEQFELLPATPLWRPADAEDCHVQRCLCVASPPASFSSGSDVYQHEGSGPMQAAVCLQHSHHAGDLCVKRKNKKKKGLT